MSLYSASLAGRGFVAAQILLTQQDFVRRLQYENARNTIERLLSVGAIPVVNENDTVATDEIRFGDNDRLAALVANLVKAKLLLLLTDTEGLHASDPVRTREPPSSTRSSASPPSWSGRREEGAPSTPPGAWHRSWPPLG